MLPSTLYCNCPCNYYENIKKKKKKVVPSLNQVTHQHSCVPTMIANCSNVFKTIGKGTKVALGTYDFDKFSVLSKEAINMLTSPDSTQMPSLSQVSDPVAHLTSQMAH